MAGYDRMVLEEKLIEKGWRVVEVDGKDMMIPPASLFERAMKHYHVYQAQELQNLLGDPAAEEEDAHVSNS